MTLRAVSVSLLGVCLLGCQSMRPLPPAPVAKQPSGYAFDNPRLLTQQIIWGLDHGARLLSEACQRRGDETAGATYRNWRAAQQTRLDIARRDLARHYFAADQAGDAEIDMALKLLPRLQSRDEDLGPACATFAAALSKPRYDLEKLYAARREAILKGDPAFPGAVWDSSDDAAPFSGSVTPDAVPEHNDDIH